MKQKWIWGLVALWTTALLGLTSFALFEKKNTSRQLSVATELTERQSKLHQAELDLYRNTLTGNYFLQDYDIKLPDSIHFFTEDSDTIYGKTLFDREKLVFRFSENNCSECINHEFSLLKEYVDSIGVDNLVIIGDYSENEYLEYVRQDAPDDVLCLNDKQYFRTLPFERMNLPYFLLINEKMEMSHLMILEKSFDRFTHDYLGMYLKRKNN